MTHDRTRGTVIFWFGWLFASTLTAWWQSSTILLSGKTVKTPFKTNVPGTLVSSQPLCSKRAHDSLTGVLNKNCKSGTILAHLSDCSARLRSRQSLLITRMASWRWSTHDETSPTKHSGAVPYLDIVHNLLDRTFDAYLNTVAARSSSSVLPWCTW